MTDVLSLPSMFLNASFGKVIVLYGKKPIKENTRFLNIGKQQAERQQDFFMCYE